MEFAQADDDGEASERYDNIVEPDEFLKEELGDGTQEETKTDNAEETIGASEWGGTRNSGTNDTG